MEAALAPQQCCRTWGRAGQAMLVRTGNSTQPEGLAAGPGTCKPWMQSRSADLSKCRAHSTQRGPQTRSQMRTSDLAAIGNFGMLGHLQRDPRPSEEGRAHVQGIPWAAPHTAASPAAPCRQGEGNRLCAGAAVPKQAKDFARGAGSVAGGSCFSAVSLETATAPQRNRAPPGSAARCRRGTRERVSPPQPAPVAALQPPHALPAVQACCSARGGSRPPGADARETAGGRS